MNDGRLVATMTTEDPNVRSVAFLYFLPDAAGVDGSSLQHCHVQGLVLSSAGACRSAWQHPLHPRLTSLKSACVVHGEYFTFVWGRQLQSAHGACTLR